MAANRHSDGAAHGRVRAMVEAGGLAVGLAQAAYAVVALAYIAYAAYLLHTGLLRRPLDRGALPVALAVAATAAWGALAWADLASTRLWTAAGAALLDHARYAAWTAVLLVLLGRPLEVASGMMPARSYRRAGRVIAVALPLVVVSAHAVTLLSTGQAESAARVLLGGQLAWAVFGLVLVEQVFRNQAESSRWAAKPLCLGLVCLFAYDVYLYAQAFMFAGHDADALVARGLVHAAVVPLLVMATRRQAHWLDRVRVSKTVAFYSASLVLIGAYLLFIAAAGYYVKYFGGSWGGALQVALLATALTGLAVLIFSGALRARVRVFLGKHFFSYRYDYRLEWLRFTAMLSSRSTPQEVGGLVVRGLADMVECPGGGLWFKALGDHRYVQSAVWNMPASGRSEATDSTLCTFIREHQWIVDLNAARAGTGPRNEALAVPEWLLQSNAWIVVPLLVGDDMLGFVVLLQPRTQLELNWEVRDLLKTAARQAAGFLAQMHATEALLEARKFDAFNRMSAFVVHDLKNIITQLSLMMKNAERHRDNPEFQQDMLATVESSLDKMRQMMLQLREGERPAGVASGVELAPLLQRIQRAAAQRGRQVEVEVVDRIATRGHEQRLERVIGHVVQNALDATPATGRVWVRLEQASGRALVVVGDNGAGMSQEFIRTRLFRPFNSTKASGMGIGSYESFQYITELGGSVDVKSEVGAGSVISLLLPLFESRSATDLRAPEVLQ